MKLIDTHTHIFLEEFDKDRDKVVQRAIESGVEKLLLPNIDSSTIDSMLQLAQKHPNNCLPMMGLHPCSVNDKFEQELKIVEDYLEKERFYAVGEIGIDLYWDKTYKLQQEQAFAHQIELAKRYKLPIVVHVRESFDETLAIVDKLNDENLIGIFHCFTGNYNQAKHIIEYGGFKLGVGGVITFKNSKLGEVIEKIPIEHIVLETDSPYLAPTPYRGKRNESSYVVKIAKKIAELHNKSIEEIAETTTKNALELFKIK